MRVSNDIAEDRLTVAAVDGLFILFERLKFLFSGKVGLFRAILLVMAFAASAFAIAQGDTAPLHQASDGALPSGSYGYNATEMLNTISSSVQNALAELSGKGQLSGYGYYIAAFFLSSLMIWTAVKTMAAGKGFGEMLGEWIPLFISYGIVYLFINQGVARQVDDTVTGIATSITGIDMSNLASASTSVISKYIAAWVAVVESPTSELGSSGNVLDALANFGSAVVSYIYVVSVKFLISLLLVLAIVVSLGHILVATITIQLAFILAPLMVPFLMFRPMSWVFEGWLKFLIGASLLKLVTGFLIKIAAAILVALPTLAQQLTKETTYSAADGLHVDVMLYGMMVVFAMLSTLILMQAPTLTQGLLSGGGSMGFGGIRSVMQSSGMRLAGSATDGAAGRVKAKGAELWSSYKGGQHAQKTGQRDLKYRNPQSKAGYERGFQKKMRELESKKK